LSTRNKTKSFYAIFASHETYESLSELTTGRDEWRQPPTRFDETTIVSVSRHVRLTTFYVSGAGEAQGLGDDDCRRGCGGYGGDGHGRDRGTAADRPVEPVDAVASETFVVVDAPQRFRGGRFEVFEEGLQDDDGGQQPVHHIQGEQGEPEETGEVVGAEGEESHQDVGHSVR